MALNRFLMLAITAALIACGNDDSDFSTQPAGDSSSSIIEDGNDSSSSNEQTKSSSSVSVSSSSADVEFVDPSAVIMGSLTDKRDGREYKTLKIGNQVWMAENLDIETANSYCYNDSAENCSKYGRLYQWSAAMDSAGTWTANGKGCGYNTSCTPTYPVRGVCPEGWHLPSQEEWKTLFVAVGGTNTAGKMLKSTSGWDSEGNGTGAYSFNAMPNGRYYEGGYKYAGRYAYFWSSTERNSKYAYTVYFDFFSDIANVSDHYENEANSVRCIKD